MAKDVKMCERCRRRPAKRRIRGLRLGLLCGQCIKEIHQLEENRQRDKFNERNWE